MRYMPEAACWIIFRIQVLVLKSASPSRTSTLLPMYVVHISIMIPSNRYALQVPIEWEEVDVTPILKGGKTVIPDAAISSVKKNTVALKGACRLCRLAF